MARIKKLRQKGFTIVDNTVIEDTELSWKAKGVFLYLWSKSDDWQFYEVEVAKHAKDGRDSLRSALKELETRGYLRRARDRNDKGQVTTSDWVLSEKPMLENPTQEKPMQENDTLPSTDLTKYLSNQELNNSCSSKQLDETNAFVAYQLSGATLNGKTTPMLTDYVQRLGNDLVCHAIDIMSVQASHPNFSFLQKILDGYEDAGITTVEQAVEAEKLYKDKKRQRQNNWSNRRNNASNEVEWYE
ncbi:DnaD domain protein [Ligilactobacillus apodemi]|uniref:Primosome n=1 Tax=Ligilactobacillus apodemi DSM 16634 = JCM 16172 TaxID=1423724 RepID=A0A0R1U0G2_9LACO|nr:DnaD domain protein [Ligilactobacillus apodemi]KRL84632.1 primosome [Ligilactobacillus apodemi DSM 16634 = JCM 16172]